MIAVSLGFGADLAGFRAAVRGLWAQQVAPHEVAWNVAVEADLFGDGGALPEAPAVALPRAVAELVELVVCHSDPERFALLYGAIWRVLSGERRLLEMASDPLVHGLEAMAKSVRRDIHKMHAFVRFREVVDPRGEGPGRERYVAWFEPQHHILEAVSGFFVERFRALVWSILTPRGSLHWDGSVLTIGPPAHRDDAPAADDYEAAWRSYYESVFNPARLNPRAMRQHMPAKYWRNLLEARSIPDLIEGSRRRVQDMLEREAALAPKRDPLKAVAAMAHQGPQGLEELNRLIAASPPLTAGADHAVVGEGPVGAAIAFVGEQPGDQEEREGRPFVGPAGQLLDKALAEAGIDRRKAYLTNAVKHFKFEPRGKKRLHKRPNPGEVKRYRWWLQKELALVGPRLVVALGNTALLGLTGEPLSVMKSRGPLALGGFAGYATVHPSYLLRLPDERARQAAYRQFRDDLRQARELVSEAARPTGAATPATGGRWSCGQPPWEAGMPASDAAQKELDDFELKLRNARQAAAAPGATERDKSDLKLIEQAYLAAQQEARRGQKGTDEPHQQSSDPKKRLDQKLDIALKETFPSSDPVAVAEPTPVKEHDRALPEVKVSEQQAPQKAKAARKAG